MMMSHFKFFLNALFLASFMGISEGWLSAPLSSSSRIFLRTIPTTTTTMPTKLSVSTGYDNFCIEKLDSDGPIYPEEARKFRRTVYTHDDWKKHRAQGRFGTYLGSLLDSGVYQNSKREVFACTGAAVLVCVYNALATGFVDLAGIEHGAMIGLDKIGVPLSAFTVTSPALGLLLSKLCCSVMMDCVCK